jgi:hypothetical protein
MGGMWYLQNEGSDVIGPVTTDLVVEGILKGRVPITSKVCQVGGSAWVPLVTQPEFARAIRQIAPPPPASSSSPPKAPRATMGVRWWIAATIGAAVLFVVVVLLVVALSVTANSTATTASVTTSRDAACVPRATALVCAGTACGQNDDGCGGAVHCGPCAGSSAPAIASTVAAPPMSLRAMDVCYQLQVAGVVYDCRTQREQAARLNQGVVDAAAFLFTAEVYGQVGTPGFVFQFGEAAAYEQMRKKLHCNEGAPCLGSSATLLLVKTVYGDVPIPDRDWSKIQGVIRTPPNVVTIPVPVHPAP